MEVRRVPQTLNYSKWEQNQLTDFKRNLESACSAEG